jgi:RNA polymerase sigma-70 factor (ECF subfamily)
MEEKTDLIPTRASLLSRLKRLDDSESWQVCYDTYWKLIFNAARRAGLTETEAEDVVQETLLSVARGIQNFNYDKTRGSFKGWLIKTTAWRIQDQLRKRVPGRLEFVAELQEDIHPIIENEVKNVWDTEWDNNIISAATERVKRRISPKHFQIFDLAVLRGWSTARISAELNISSSCVYITKHRVNICFKAELATLRRKTE